MWSGSVASIPAGWALCNGANGTPNLENYFIVGAGSTYTPGQTGGASSVTTTTDTQGSHSRGGATASNGPWGITGSTDTQGSHYHTGSTGSHALSSAELPSHNHEVLIGGWSASGGSLGFVGPGTGSVNNQTFVSDGGAVGNLGHTHAISVDGAHAHNLTISNAPAHAHSISVDGSHLHNVTVATLPPFYALAFIMKL